MILHSQKEEIQQRVLKNIDLSRHSTDEEIMEYIDDCILAYGRTDYIPLKDKIKIKKDIFNSIRRLDILQDLIEDKSITEIMVNGTQNIFIEQEGKIRAWHERFHSRVKLEQVVQQMISQSNRIINESNPIADARLEDGSRINIVLPPVAMEGPIITIRKFPEEAIRIEQLIQWNSISEEVAEFLRKLVVSGYNIFISGGTGSGKTTFLNVLSNFIPTEERIITIEDSAELQIRNVPNLVRLEVRNANTEGKKGITIRDLIRTALRMRPDRIIIGEVRDEAALDLLQALNTGHDGSLSTGHANSPRDMLSRLESLVLMGADIPLLAIRKQIASAIDIVVHLGRLRDRSRRVLEIMEVIDCIDGEYQVRSLYSFMEDGEEQGRIIGKLYQMEELSNREKLQRAGISWE